MRFPDEAPTPRRRGKGPMKQRDSRQSEEEANNIRKNTEEAATRNTGETEGEEGNIRTLTGGNKKHNEKKESEWRTQGGHERRRQVEETIRIQTININTFPKRGSAKMTLLKRKWEEADIT